MAKAGRVTRLRSGCAVATMVALLLIGAFLAWGPIGLGNGPLYLGNSAGFVQGYPDAGPTPLGFMVGLRNSGDASAVISTVHCLQAPVQSLKPHLIFRQCQVQDLGSLYGRPMARLPFGFGYLAVAVPSPPPSREFAGSSPSSSRTIA
jgi:hypothetical protein